MPHLARSELIAAHDRTEEVSRARSRFLATISHETRTPLKAIQGMSQLLRDRDPELLDERTALIFRAASTLESIVDEVLDHARIEAGRFRLRPEDADIAEAARSVLDSFRQSAEARGLTLELDVSGRVPAFTRFDVLRAQQVMGNLVSNAVKYSHGGPRHWPRSGSSGLLLSCSTCTCPRSTVRRQLPRCGASTDTRRRRL